MSWELWGYLLKLFLCPHFSLTAGTLQLCQQCLEQLAPSIWCWGGCRDGEGSLSPG